jgi:hypothetical protein
MAFLRDIVDHCCIIGWDIGIPAYRNCHWFNGNCFLISYDYEEA